MNTSTFFTDFLIIGIQVSVWMVLAFLSLFGVDWLVLEKFKGWENTLGVLLLPLAYPVGIFIDNLADSMLKRWEKTIKTAHGRGEKESVMDVLILTGSDALRAYFEYLRVRIRISRSSALNFAMIAIFFPVFVHRTLPGSSGPLLAVTVATACLTLSALALFTWHRLTGDFHRKAARVFPISKISAPSFSADCRGLCNDPKGSTITNVDVAGQSLQPSSRVAPVQSAPNAHSRESRRTKAPSGQT